MAAGQHPPTSSPRAVMLGAAYLSFVNQGLSTGLIGVTWPSMRTTFGVSLDALGTLMAAGTTGYLLASFSSGRIVSRIGVGTLVLTGNILRIGGVLGFVLATSWWAIVPAVALMGMGGAWIEMGLNHYVAANHRTSQMNWLHACYGVGATIGPIGAAWVLAAGHSWRWGYAALCTGQVALAVFFALTRPRWQCQIGAGETGPTDRTSYRDTLRAPIVWLSIALFFTYTGTEGTTGTWAYTLLTEGRGVAATTAGLWISIYWGGLPVGRIVLGFVVDRIKPKPLLRIAMLGMMVGAALIWWNAVDALSMVGLTVMGLAMSTIYPVLLAETPNRVGARHAANAIGFQGGAASLGAAVLAGLAGALAEGLGLEIIGPYLLAGSALVFILHEAAIPLAADQISTPDRSFSL